LEVPREEEITQVLADLGGTDQAGMAALLPMVYDELRSLADAYLKQERPDHTLQPTALVHEAYLRLAKAKGSHWENRVHFYRVAAKTMRRILINHARGHGAEKRGGGRKPISLNESQAASPGQAIDLLALDDALTRLSSMDTTAARIVELRFFGGCTISETAEALDISPATVERDWRTARAWLHAELGSA
jgi:RNA polymerase sigma factor (TIGR02999 family)